MTCLTCVPKRTAPPLLFLAALSLLAPARSAPLTPATAPLRPYYRIDATVDFELLTFKGTEQVTVPVAPGDTLRDVVLMVYANAGGPGGSDASQKMIAVDQVTLDGAPLSFSLQGPVLRVRLPQEERQPFVLRVSYRGVAPRSPASSGGMMDLMGDVSEDLGGLLGGLMGNGGAAGAPRAHIKDYGLYTYGSRMLSLGAYWYPQLAVRRGGQWADQAPEGLGDVEYAEMSDFGVTLHVPRGVVVAAAGKKVAESTVGAETQLSFLSANVRDFALLMSQDYTWKSRAVDIDGKTVSVEAYTLKRDSGRADAAIDIAAHALRIYSHLFGLYPYNDFRVVEGPIRGGAGGMEFSTMTSIASALYGDLDKQMNALAGELGAGNLESVMGELNEDGAGQTAPPGSRNRNTPATPPAPENPASSLLNGLMGSQKEIFDSLFEVTIAHEVAHQWWAIGVGSDSQNDPFVDESLAQYSAMLYFEDRYGIQKAQKMMEVHLRSTYSMGRMLGGGDAPANLKTSAYQNNLQYGAVVYGKGALYYGALRHTIGDTAFFASLREYYRRYGGRLAGPRSLLEIVKTQAPARAAQVEALYHRWIEEAHGDQDIAGGSVPGLGDLLGGLLATSKE